MQNQQLKKKTSRYSSGDKLEEIAGKISAATSIGYRESFYILKETIDRLNYQFIEGATSLEDLLRILSINNNKSSNRKKNVGGKRY